MKSNSTINNGSSSSSINAGYKPAYVAASPAPGAAMAAGIGVKANANEWGDKNLLAAGGWFKLRLTIASKGKGVLENISAIGGSTGGSICALHNGFLRWSKKHSESARLLAWPALVPFKRTGFEYSFDQDGYPEFDKASGLHMYWAAPVEGLQGEDQELLNAINEWQHTGDNTIMAGLMAKGIGLDRIQAVLAQVMGGNAKPKARKMNPYALLQQLQGLSDDGVPTYARIRLALPESATEEILEWISNAASEGMSGVLDIYVKDRLSMRSETVKPYQYKNEAGELVELKAPTGHGVKEFQYNWGTPMYIKWNAGESLWEPDQSRLFSMEQSRKMAEKSVNAAETKARGAEIEQLGTIIEDKLGDARGNKWAVRVGCLPAGPGQSCPMWDDISTWGDEARNIWEGKLSGYVGKLPKPFGWKGEGMFSEEHIEAMMDSVGNFAIWQHHCNIHSTATPAPAVVPAVVIPTTPVVVAPEPTPAVAPAAAPTMAALGSAFLGGCFVTDDEEDEGGNY